MKKIFILIAAAAVCCACADKVEYDACGTFEATEVVVSSQGTGQIMSFDAEEGSEVEAGQQIGLIDTVQLYLQKTQLEAQMQSVLSSRPDIESQVSAIRSQIAKQKSEKERVEKLMAKGAAPAKQLDDINAQIGILEDQLAAQLSALSKSASSIGYNAAALQSQIAQLEDRIAKCRIISPVKGTVIAKYVNQGELATVGTPMMKVADLEKVYLRAYFTSDQLSDLNLGDKVDVTADFGGDKQYSYEGKVVWISSQSEFTPKAIQTRNSRANLVYAVKIAVENDGRLKLGMYGECNIR